MATFEEQRSLPLKTGAAGAQVQAKYEWIYQLQQKQSIQATEPPSSASRCTYSHKVTVEQDLHRGRWVQVAAFQASEEGSEGSDSQHIQFCRASAEPTTGQNSSNSSSSRWEGPGSVCKCVAWGLLPLWSPVLKAILPPQATPPSHSNIMSKLLLFYSESRKVRAPLIPMLHRIILLWRAISVSQLDAYIHHDVDIWHVSSYSRLAHFHFSHSSPISHQLTLSGLHWVGTFAWRGYQDDLLGRRR